MNNTQVAPIDTNAAEKSAHLKQVERERVEQAKYLAANPKEALGSGAAIAALQNVYFSNIPQQFEWGKSLTVQGAFALATASAQTGLNPLFGQLIMLGGQMYLPEKGCHHIANTDPRFDGYELEPVPKSEFDTFGFKPDEIAFKCSVYRKDRSRPTVAYGRASVANVSLPAVQKHWLSEMAQKRAIQRAMIRAFALPFCGADEIGEDMVNVTPATEPSTADVPTIGTTRADAAKLALMSTKAHVPKWISSPEPEEFPLEIEKQNGETLVTHAFEAPMEVESQVEEVQAETEQKASVKIDPQVIEDFRGMIPIPDMHALCAVAESCGMTGLQLRDIVKKGTNGEVMTKVTYGKIISTLEQLPKASA